MTTVKYVLAIGDAFNGITLYGPFETSSDASEYGEANHSHDEWVIVRLHGYE